MRALRNIYINWCLFALYVTLIFTFPVAVLGNYLGLAVGLSASLIFLIILFVSAEQKIEEKLHLYPLTPAEEPQLYHALKELSRRLNLPTPQLKLLKTEALTIGAFGVTKARSSIIVSDGLLQNMDRSELIALLARELTAIWYGDTILSTWLSRFLAALEFCALHNQKRNSHRSKNKYPLQWLLLQVVFLPLALVPQNLLLRVRRQVNLSKESLKISHLPLELAEAFCKIEASVHRKTFFTPLNLAPLFLVPPSSEDPVSKLLFSDYFKRSLLDSLTQPAEQT